MRSAVFCIDLSVFNRSLGRSHNKELQFSSFQLMNACIKISVVSIMRSNKFLVKYFVIKTSDKKYERRFDRSTVTFKFKFKFMDKIIPHIYNFWNNGIKSKKQVFAYKQ